MRQDRQSAKKADDPDVCDVECTVISSETVDDNKKIIEAFIFDFEGDLYGKEVEIGFTKFIRKQMKFSSIQELKEQIEKDILH